MVFLRDHLSPRYSEIAKPLRDNLAEPQKARRDGKKKGKAKFRPLGNATPDDPTKWPDWWQQDQEDSFNACENMVCACH